MGLRLAVARGDRKSGRQPADPIARAVITGTLNGKKVHVTIIDGGCTLGQWSKLSRVMF